MSSFLVLITPDVLHAVGNDKSDERERDRAERRAQVGGERALRE